MAREPPATQRNVSTVDSSRRHSAETAAESAKAQDAKARRDEKRALNQVRGSADICGECMLWGFSFL